MRNRRARHSELQCLLVFLCVGLLLTTSIRAEQTKGAAKSIPFGSTTTVVGSKYNGKLVFASDRQDEGGIKLWTINPDGSNPTQLTFESDREPSLPSYVHVYDDLAKWSPDGKRIAFQSIRSLDPDNDPYTIYIMEYETRLVRRIIVNELRSTNSAGICSEMHHAEWSPDGTRLVFEYGKQTTGEDFCLGPFDTDIYTINADGTGFAVLTNDVNVVNSDPTWSPDGSQIAFVSEQQTGEQAISLEVINNDGSGRHTIARYPHNTFLGSTMWSPDGTRILFLIAGQLYTLRPDGTELKRLTNSNDYHSARWSPDGTKIATVRNLLKSAQNYQISVMNADGSDEHQISNRTSEAFGDFDVDWQPLLAPANEPPPSVLGLSEKLIVLSCPSSLTVEIPVTRGGNLNQSISCAYQTRTGNLTRAPVTLSFAPGETAKNAQLSGWSCDVSQPTRVSLVNNAGNSTFVGGVKDATVVFVSSNANVIDNSAYFVRQHYRDFLSREPDAAGWDFWTNNIDICGSGNSRCSDPKRVSTSAAFFLSIEFQQTGYLVERMYKAAYGDGRGTSTWSGLHQLDVPMVRFNEFLSDTQQIGQGVVVLQPGWEQALENNKQNFAAGFVQRSRFQTAFPTSLTPEQFVDKLNANAGNVLSLTDRATAVALFGSAPDTSNLMARAQALRQVAENQNLSNAEFNRAFVLMQYFGYLRRNPDDAPEATRDYTGYDFWLTKLNFFNGNFQAAEMVKAFITSIEYRQRFGQI